MPRLDGFPAGGLVVKHHQIPTRLRMGLYQINVFTFTIEFKYFSLDASVVVFTHCWCPLILESPCTCTLSKAGIPTALVNLISPFYMSMVRALLFSFLFSPNLEDHSDQFFQALWQAFQTLVLLSCRLECFGVNNLTWDHLNMYSLWLYYWAHSDKQLPAHFLYQLDF